MPWLNAGESGIRCRVDAQIAVGTAYRAVGQYDRALAELRRALSMSPGNNRVHFQLGATFAAMGRMDDAIRELEIARATSPRAQFEGRGVPGIRLRGGGTDGRRAGRVEGTRCAPA